MPERSSVPGRAVLLTVVALVALAALSGCLGTDGSEPAESAADTIEDLTPLAGSDDEESDRGASAANTSWPRCEHPWPCGDGSEWPPNLTGPFEIQSVERVNVTSFDGTRLHGWILRPDVPDGVEVPVLMGSTPYTGVSSPQAAGGDVRPGDPYFGPSSEGSFGVNLSRMAERGYAVALFDVRGTGSSGGCLDYFGPQERQDQAVLVDWVGNRSWSNGRVAMLGLSYRAGTTWEAAVQAPEPLKATVTAGIVTDWYTFYNSPQGAHVEEDGVPLQNAVVAAASGPYIDASQPVDTARRLPGEPSRACAEPATGTARSTADIYRDQRVRDYWEPRRIIDQVPNVTAATLLTHGFHDSRGHAWQDNAVWRLMPEDTPRAMIGGQWSHEFPHSNSYRSEWTLDDWNERAVEWLDFWLKGIGEPPDDLGTVDYQDDTGTWHETTAWPPAEATDEVLHLTAEGLDEAPGTGSKTFQAAPDPVASDQADDSIGFRGGESPGPICPIGPQPAGEESFASYVLEPLDEAARIAGNPLAYLNLTSTQPGGLLQVTVLDLGPDFRCNDQGQPQDATWVSQGSADLRFHDGGYTGEDFPVDEPTRVRVDLKDHAAVVEEGHRVGVWLSYGHPNQRSGQPQYQPAITVHGDSEIVLPVVEGTLGGHEPTHDYPPRPFVPGG